MVECGGCASARERCGNGLEKIYPTTAVRFGRMRYIGEFSYPPDMKFSCGAKVIIGTERGIEIGEQVSLTCHGCDKSVTRDQMRAYAKNSGADFYRLSSGRILREATAEDIIEQRHIEDQVFAKIEACRALAESLGLPMKIIDAEHVFGGERIIFYFMAEDRVDFRELVRQLAREFQTRIEMKQVGARDEARLLADYETCGRECCCKNFLKALKPVNMQMAKLQKATLDPSKVSGRCGRLKCCLRYEHESYDDLNKKLPRTGRWVKTADIVGKVIDRQVLTQLLKLRTLDGRLVSVCNEDLVERNLPEPEAARMEAQPDPRAARRAAPNRSDQPRKLLRDQVSEDAAPTADARPPVPQPGAAPARSPVPPPAAPLAQQPAAQALPLAGGPVDPKQDGPSEPRPDAAPRSAERGRARGRRRRRQRGPRGGPGGSQGRGPGAGQGGGPGAGQGGGQPGGPPR